MFASVSLANLRVLLFRYLQVAQEGGGVSILEDIQKPSGHNPEQLAVDGPA